MANVPKLGEVVQEAFVRTKSPKKVAEKVFGIS